MAAKRNLTNYPFEKVKIRPNGRLKNTRFRANNAKSYMELGRVMLGILVAIRNFFIALVLAWVGIKFTAPDTSPEPQKPQANVLTSDCASFG